ncbi:hypothetical protein [Actinomadura sp. NAK00032]|uniref:hypothetical protein n=1 Tax=Actinomadura sp. NAK00032 TaxID=2742128 RepID=UPI001C376322|nr:hypothetical protein [Actinomadura sp. NAK00032]
MTGPDFDEEPAEHRRFARYLHDLEAVDESDEADLVAVVLGDQDTTMAESAVGRHMDRRAAQLLATAAFTLWTDTMADVIADHDFLTRRLHEWRLLRTIVMGDPWHGHDHADRLLARGTQTAPRPRTNPPNPKRREPPARSAGAANLN